MSEYASALSALDRLEAFGMRLGLENVAAYCASAGHPERAFPSLHVAGTNGKGTTAVCLAELGRAAELRTGLYTSPHLVEVRERIRVDGRPIPESGFVEAWRRVGPFVEQRAMTYFEAGTLVAFEWFARRKVDLAVLEVGLGGRLDATNVVRPELSIVTNVALDHERHLGADPPAIAREKAGIFKPGVPALVGDGGDRATRAALAEVASAVGAPLAWLETEARWEIREADATGTTFDYESEAGRIADLRLPLVGAQFVADAALALRAWERVRGPLEAGRTRAALATAAPPGRAERRDVDGIPVLLDVAHNPAAIERLVDALGRVHPVRWTFVAGFLSDKRWERMLDALLALAPSGRLCGLASASPGRRLSRDDARAALDRRPGVRWSAGVGEALAAARADVVSGDADEILVTGSFHTVGEALVALGIARAGRPYEPAARAPASAPRLSGGVR